MKKRAGSACQIIGFFTTLYAVVLLLAGPFRCTGRILLVFRPDNKKWISS